MNTAAIIGLILVAGLLLLMLFRREGSDSGPGMTGPRDVDGGHGD